ncbi:MAG: NADPH-dependent F420 reductase [Stellaceae bacterium]
MRIAIIGAGHVGQALAPAWLKRGHELRFGVPNPADAKYRALPAPAARPQEAAAQAEAIALATPWHATEAAIRSLGDVSGRIVIDCTNPLGMRPDGLGLVLGHDISGGETVAQWAQGAAVFKAFNTTGAANLADPSRYRPPPVMFVAGDDAARKPVVMDLVRESGFEPRDVGPLKLARLLEPFAMLWIDQSLNRGAGSDFVFTVQRTA